MNLDDETKKRLAEMFKEAVMKEGIPTADITFMEIPLSKPKPEPDMMGQVILALALHKLVTERKITPSQLDLILQSFHGEAALLGKRDLDVYPKMVDGTAAGFLKSLDPLGKTFDRNQFGIEMLRLLPDLLQAGKNYHDQHDKETAAKMAKPDEPTLSNSEGK